MLRKLLITIIALFAAVSLAACGNNNNADAQNANAPAADAADAQKDGAADAAGTQNDGAAADGQDAAQGAAENGAAANGTGNDAAGNAAGNNAAQGTAAADNTAGGAAQNTAGDAAGTGLTDEKKEIKSDGVIMPKEFLDEPRDAEVSGTEGIGLFLRQGPSSTYGDIDLIPEGTKVTIQAEMDNWGFTTYRDQYGWVSLDFIS